MAAASLLWAPGQGQPRGERGGALGGAEVRTLCNAMRADLVCSRPPRPGAGFHPREAGGALAACPQLPPGSASEGEPCCAARGAPRGEVGWSQAVLLAFVPRSLRPPSFIPSLLSAPRCVAALPRTFLKPFLLPRRRGPLRQAASGAAHSLCGSRETLWSGRNPGEVAAPAVQPLPRSPGQGGGLAGGPGPQQRLPHRGRAPSAAPGPAGDGAGAGQGSQSRGSRSRRRERRRQSRRMPHAGANINQIKLSYTCGERIKITFQA